MQEIAMRYAARAASLDTIDGARVSVRNSGSRVTKCRISHARSMGSPRMNSA
jgi:hypothetical protein